MRRLWQAPMRWVAAADRLLVACCRYVQRAGLAFGRRLDSLVGIPAQGYWLHWSPAIFRYGRLWLRKVFDWLRRVPLCVWLALMSLAAAGFAAFIWRLENGQLLTFLRLPEIDVPRLVGEVAILVHLVTVSRLAFLLMVLAALGVVAAFVRHAASLWILKSVGALLAMFVLTLVPLAWRCASVLHAMDMEAFPTPSRNEVWVSASFKLLWLVVFALLFLFVLVLRATSNYYRREQSNRAALGDRIWRNLRSNGNDPVYRKSLYRSVILHVFFILVLPYLMIYAGCSMQPYGVPKGSGITALQVVKVQRQKKKKEEKEYVFNKDTAISFYVPKIEESEVFEEVDNLTEHVYQAEKIGKLGAGGGTTGGWPNGMENAKVRFIRLKYSGGDWDQDMGYGADYNMLLVFRDLTGFDIWHKTEAVRIPQLKRFPRKRAPPFVYITGRGGLDLSSTEIKVLRQYCLKMGGMIFADNGGGSFDTSFRRACRQIFPELPLLPISHDDVIYQAPFLFPDGAPPLWHHSGTQAMGVKYQGRWVVFYHQGDINDAWKDGHSGASKGIAAQAYKMGINVIAYSFNQYMRINFGGTVQK